MDGTIAEIAVAERAMKYLHFRWSSFPTSAGAGIVLGKRGGASHPCRFATLVGGAGRKFYDLLVKSRGEYGWMKSSIIRGGCGGVPGNILLVREPTKSGFVRLWGIRTREEPTS